jgi:dihydroorotase
MNEGPVATRLGLPGVPAHAEAVMIARDIELAALTEGRLHVPHVSTRAGVAHIHAAKARGLNITAEVTPHHLSLDDRWVYGLHGKTPDTLSPVTYDTNTRVSPPLRSPDDVAAVVEALADGTIDVIATDHAPHASTDKVCTYNEAANGINVLETAFGQVAGLVHSKAISLPELIRRMTEAPARILGMKLGSLKKGYPADVTLLDPNAEWKVDPASFASKSRNTPLAGVTLKGRVVATIAGGKTVWDARTAAVATGGRS